ncbi:MAG: histidine kinase dimerization/phospho-acceptor domain-containing protein [Erysipelotrichaceae bacterium]|nr:histidine kinase dimerization/phospho-acceptor domain-containing protein [Erysipelotrichaceae bacterium]
MFDINILLTAEIMSVVMMAIGLLGLFTKRNRSKSSNALVLVFLCNLLSLFADICAYSFQDLPRMLVLIIWTIAYSSGSLTIIAMINYWYHLISEYTTVKKLYFQIPQFIFVGTFIHQVFRCLTGQIMTIGDGVVTYIDDGAYLVNILYFIIIVYLIVITLRKSKQLGFRNTQLFVFVLALPFVSGLASFIFSNQGDFIFVSTAISLILIYILIQNYRLIERDEMLLDKNKALMDRMHNIEAMHSIYTSMYDIDMSTGDFVELSALDDVENYIPKKANCRITNPEFCKKMMLSEFSEEMLAFVDIDTLDERMGDKKFIAKRYLSTIPIPGYDEKKGIWTEVCLIDDGRNPDGSLSHVLFTTRTIHDEVIKELEHQEKQKKNLSIFKSLGEIYASLYYIDLNKNRFEVITSPNAVQNQIGKGGNAQEPFYHMCDHMVLPEYREAMLSFTDLSTLTVRLNENKIVKQQFQSSLPLGPNKEVGTWVEAQFIDAGRDEEGNVTNVIFATQSIQYEKLKELEAKDKIEKALEEAKTANKAKTDFLFNMSHDIRTPMNAIIGFRDLLEKNQDDPLKRQDYLDKIKNANDVLLSIINNVLEMTRIEQGNVELDETVGNIEQFVNAVESMFIEMMEQKNISFTHSINVEHEYVYGDMTKVREIYINLLSNAYKYTNAGGSIHLAVDELPGEKEGYALLRTTISDNGIGWMRNS